MPRICTTVDADVDERLRAEAHRRRITRARLLREAALHYLGTSEALATVQELRAEVQAQALRIERLERELAGPLEGGSRDDLPSLGGRAAPTPGSRSAPG